MLEILEACTPSELDEVRALFTEYRQAVGVDLWFGSAFQRELDELPGAYAGPGGRLVVAGYHQDGPRTVDMRLWNWRGIDVVNAHERDAAVQRDGVVAAAGLVAEGRLDPEPLYTHRLPLDRLGEALELTRTRPDGFMKALVTT